MGTSIKNQEIFYSIDTFKGLNQSGDNFNIGTDFLLDLLNGYLDITSDGRGAVQQRYGLTKLNQTAAGSSNLKIRFLEEVQWNDGTKELICRVDDGWRRIDETTGTVTDLDVSRTADAKGQGVMWDNQFLMADGGKARKSSSAYSVSDLSADAAMPTDSSVIHVHQQRVWLNSDADPMKAYGSKAGDATGAAAWSTASDSITLDLSITLPKGDKIIAYRTFADTLLVIFLRKQIAIYSAPVTFADIELVQILDVGAISNNSIKQIGNDYAVPYDAGVRSLASSEATQKLDIADLTRNYANKYRSFIATDTDVEATCSGIDLNLNHYWVTLHPSTGAETLIYGIESGEIIGRYQFHINPYSFATGQDRTFYVGGDDGHVYKHVSTTNLDDTTPVTLDIELPPLGSETINSFKHPKSFETTIDTDGSVTLTISWAFGFSGELSGTQSTTLNITVEDSLWREALWREGSWRGKAKEVKKTYNLIGRGRLMNFSINSTTSDVRIRIPYFLILAIIGGIK